MNFTTKTNMAHSAKQFRPCLQKGDNSWQETHNSGILQQTISGTQTHETVATSDTFKYVKQPFTCTNFQNENSRIYQEVDSKGGVGHLDRPHRPLFSCPNSSTISKYLRFQTKKGVFQFWALPFGVATAPLEFTHCERGKTHTSSQEPQNLSISRRLASSVTNKGTLSQRFREFREIGARTRLAYQFSKVGIGTLTKTGFSELSLRSSEGSCLSNPKEA